MLQGAMSHTGTAGLPEPKSHATGPAEKGKGVLFAAGFGLWLVALGNWGYGTPWVDAAIGLLTLVAAIGWVGGQRPKVARKLAAALTAQQLPPNTELRALLGDRLSIILNYLATAALLAIIVLMVVKPGSPHQ